MYFSFHAEDERFVRDLHGRLQRDGVDCGSAPEAGAREKARERGAVLLCVVTPELSGEREGRPPAGKVIALVRRPCAPDALPGWLREAVTMDISTGTRFEAAYPRLLRECGGTSAAPAAGLPAVAPLPARRWLPYASLGNRFVGRGAAMWGLYGTLFQGRADVAHAVAVVTGAAGLGKSQLAIEYAHRWARRYPGGVFWVDADEGVPAMVDRLSAAAGLEIDRRQPEAHQAGQLWRGIDEHGPWLLVVDDLPPGADARAFIPTEGAVHVIVTTGRRDLAGYAGLALGLLSEPESLALLNSGARRFGAKAHALVARLGGLPLALKLVRAFLNVRRDVTPADWMEETKGLGETPAVRAFLEAHHGELPAGHELEAARTFEMSWRVAGEAARDVLRAMAELAPVPVPRWLLREALGLAEGGPLRDALGAAVAELSRLGLVTLDTARNPVAHPLVLSFCACASGAGRGPLREHAARAVRCRMERAFRERDAAAARELEAALPHAGWLLRGGGLPPAECMWLATLMGQHQRRLGRYTLAVGYMQRALDMVEGALPPDHPEIAAAQSNVAVALQGLGRLEEARELLEKALAAAERAFEPGHPAIAKRQSDLAAVLKDLGRLGAARELLEKALAAAEKHHPPGDPNVAVAQSNLAVVLQDLGQLTEARALLEQAVAAAEKALPPGHPTTAAFQGNLRDVLAEMNG